MPTRAQASDARRFWRGIARAVGGAIVFSLPALMTMEVWRLGFHMDSLRLALFLVLALPLLTALSHFAGFQASFDLKDDVRGAFIAYAVGFVVATVILGLFAVLGPGMSADELIGKVALQAAGSSIGALLARSQFGDEEAQKEAEARERRTGYAGDLFFMGVGALVLSYTLAPTEEMILIAYQMTEWHGVALAVVTVAVMHGFVFAVGFPGEPPEPPPIPWWSRLFRYTVVGYALALLLSLYMLWMFGRAEGTAPEQLVVAAVVLGFPAAMGAAARLIL